MLAVKDDKVVSDEMFAFMEKSDDEEVEEEVTLSDFKQNLHVYSIKRLRSLAAVLIDSITKLTSKKDLMNNSTLDIFHDEKVVLVSQMKVMEEQMVLLYEKGQLEKILCTPCHL